MEVKPNPAPAEVMHIDLNSAFAMTEQQANPLLRGRPVGVTNRLNDYAICIAASYEAKRLGINLGTRNGEARVIAPNFVMCESDAAKYQYVNKQMQAIFASCSPSFTMKSVDEGVIDFRGMKSLLKGRSLEDIGAEIKQRVREEVGDYMKVNVGIGQNRWLAKVAAGFMKPDGLYTIGPDNLEAVYGFMCLTELPYIKRRMERRLNEAGIYTTLDFYHASERTLSKQVFRSVNGHHWYLKLRGYETEVEFGICTVGRSYVLEHRTADPDEMAALLYKASAKVARRLLRNKLAARGLMLWLGYVREPDAGSRKGWGGPRGWHERHMYKTATARADQLYARAVELYEHSRQEHPDRIVSALAITSYAVEPVRADQMYLWQGEEARADRIEEAMNTINDRYGELKLVPAAAMKSKNPMVDKIPFGTVRYFE
ncbi:MAG: DNA polymerase IV [Candidatus Saccharimonadales bacterium]